jgi:hypothetical protein
MVGQHRPRQKEAAIMDDIQPVEGKPAPDASSHDALDALDAEVDEAEIESFPSSDPQSSWAGPDVPERAPLAEDS